MIIISVLSAFKVSWFFVRYLSVRSNIFINFCGIFPLFSNLHIILVSSANSITSFSPTSCSEKLSTCNRKVRDPSTVPCGLPRIIVILSDKSIPKFTDCDRFVRKDLRSKGFDWERLKFSAFLRKISCELNWKFSQDLRTQHLCHSSLIKPTVTVWTFLRRPNANHQITQEHILLVTKRKKLGFLRTGIVFKYPFYDWLYTSNTHTGRETMKCILKKLFIGNACTFFSFLLLSSLVNASIVAISHMLVVGFEPHPP